jgi:hypothetical protein
MTATSLDLSQIRTDALSSAATFRTLIGLGSGDTPTFKGATLSTGTITASTPALDASQTWNNAAVTFTGILANVTDTASNAASLLMDLQVGGVSQFKVTKDGKGTFLGYVQSTLVSAYGSGGALEHWSSAGRSGSRYFMTYPAGDVIGIGGNIALAFGSGDAAITDLAIRRDAADVLAQRRTTNPQTYRIYNTYTDASNYERGKLEWSSNVLKIGTEKAGTGSARALELQTDGTTRLTIASTGAATFSSSIDCTSVLVNGSQNLAEFTHLTRLSLSVGGGGYSVVRLGGVYQSANTLITIGGTTSSFPAIKRNGTAINFRLADDSADCDVSAAHGTFSAGTDTVSTPILNLSQTWNNAATTFTGILANITDTASNAASLLLDLQVGGSSKFSVSKTGSLAIPISQIIKFGSTDPASIFQGFNASLYIGGSTTATTWAAFDANGIYIRSNAAFRWSTSATDPYATQLALFADAADTLAQRRSTNAQTYRLYGTYSDASNYRRLAISSTTAGAFTINAEGAGTGASGNTLELQTGGTTRLTIGTTGTATFTGTISGSVNGMTLPVGGNGYNFSSGGYFVCISSGVFKFSDSADTSFNRLQLGGTTSSFPAIKRNGTAINFRLADDSADCDVTAAALTLSGNLTISTKNIVTDTTTGTKIGTATTQKLGFYNATPVVQPTAVADATDAASVITQLNALLSRMRDLGLIAT